MLINQTRIHKGETRPQRHGSATNASHPQPLEWLGAPAQQALQKLRRSTRPVPRSVRCHNTRSTGIARDTYREPRDNTPRTAKRGGHSKRSRRSRGTSHHNGTLPRGRQRRGSSEYKRSVQSVCACELLPRCALRPTLRAPRTHSFIWVDASFIGLWC